MYNSSLRALHIYSLYFLQFLKSRLSYRVDFIVTLVSSAMVAVVGFSTIFFLIDGDTVQSLGGWSRDQILFIYGYSFLATAIFSTVAINLYSFGNKYIIQGQFDRVLLRPLGSLPQVLFESFNVEALGNILVGSLLLIYAHYKLQIAFTLFGILWMFFSAICGAIILISVFVTVSSLSFYMEDRVGISAPIFNLILFARYPLPIFDRPVQFFLSVIIPFGFVSFYPASYFFQEGFRSPYWFLTPLVALILAKIAEFSWERGVRKYESVGG
jgi:ABC-2 type transport system permease protein